MRQIFNRVTSTFGRPKRPGVVVLGSELAAALEAERARVALGPERLSPLEAKRYDRWSGHLRLSKVQRLPLDDEIAELGRAYRGMGDDEQASLRRSLSLDDIYTLFSFAKRNAVFALRREGDIEDGLTAVAMIERSRMDQRDVSWAIAVLEHASERTSSDTARWFAAAASFADPPVAAELRRAARRPSRHRALCNECRYAEVITAEGIGLTDWWGDRFEPTTDIAALALELADLCDSIGFCADDPWLGVEVPDFWFDSDPGLQRGLRAIRAAALVHAHGRPETYAAVSEFERPSVIAWIAELSDPETARELVRYAEPTARRPDRRAIAVGRLFGLVVGAPRMAGVEFPNAAATLDPLADALAQSFARN